MSKQSASYQPEKLPEKKYPHIPDELLGELEKLAQMPDSRINLKEMPEQLDWTDAVVGKYYRPVKQLLSIRLDADVVGWFKSQGKGYQSRINNVLRYYAQFAGTQKRDSIASLKTGASAKRSQSTFEKKVRKVATRRSARSRVR